MHYWSALFLVLTALYIDAHRPNNPIPNPDPNIVYGDMYIPPEEKQWIENEQMRQGSNFDYKSYLRWPRDKGSNLSTIYYVIEVEDYNRTQIDIITKAIDEWNRALAGCIEWKHKRFAKESPTHWMYIYKGSGCWSTVGKNRLPGPMKLSLGENCLADWDPERQITVMHEMEHSVGMIHEHNRYDRDQYIRILPDISEGMKKEFELPSRGEYIDIGEYDFYSIMHYSPDRTGEVLFEVLKEGVDKSKISIGKDKLSFSDGDVKKLKTLYECE